MIGEENVANPCSEESLGHFPGGINPDLWFPEDLWELPPEIQRPQVVETHEIPVLRVQDLGNHASLAGNWNLNKYNKVEIVVDRNCTPIIVAQDSWCKGNSKAPQVQVVEPFYTLSVTAISNDQIVRPCRTRTCPSTKEGSVAQIYTRSRLLDIQNDPTDSSKASTIIEARILCIPKHHPKSESVGDISLIFELKDNTGSKVGSDKLDIRKLTANRSKKRNDRDFRNPPLGFVFVFLTTTHFTFRTNWRFQR